MSVVAFTVDGDPISAPRPRLMKGRFVSNVSSGPYEVYKEAIAWSYKPLALQMDPWEGKVAVRLDFFTKTRRKVDGDNLEKSVLDALNGLAYLDDSQVVYCRWKKFHDPKHPRLRVHLTFLEEEAA